MRKSIVYRRVRFDAQALSSVIAEFSKFSKDTIFAGLEVDVGNAEWTYDTLEEFLAASNEGDVRLHAMGKDGGKDTALSIRASSVFGQTVSAVAAPTREKIESVFAVLDANVVRCRIAEQPKPVTPPRIFIGHGRDPQWKDLKDHLHEKHGYAIEAFEIGARAGHAIRDILEEMLDNSSFALLVMTGEDVMQDGGLRARQNVVHEAGLFQGKLGFSRAIILREEGTEEFSNTHGLIQILFSKGKIKECFGDVLAVLKREVG